MSVSFSEAFLNKKKEIETKTSQVTVSPSPNRESSWYEDRHERVTEEHLEVGSTSRVGVCKLED